MTHILTFYNDFQKYPPIISVIETLLAAGDNVIFLGYCSNNETLLRLKNKGLEYVEVIKDDITASSITKFIRLLFYKKRVVKFVNKYKKNNCRIWVFGERNAWLLHTLFENFTTVLYLFEVPMFKVHLRFKLLSPFMKYEQLMKAADTVVCCEYNRAMITQSFFHLTETPIVIPNKPVLKNLSIPNLCEIDENLYEICSNYKVILYQGIFNYPERRLNELCEAMNLLPETFHLIIMGPNDSNKSRLKAQYLNKRIHFADFLKYPDHLSVTQMAYIGFLSYFSRGGVIESSLNTLYCAPNKIYEYALCKIPSISNELPAMRAIYNQFSIGKVVDFKPEEIAKTILDIDRNYDSYNDFSTFIESVDTEDLINYIRTKC